jgi:hypothetical protein
MLTTSMSKVGETQKEGGAAAGSGAWGCLVGAQGIGETLGWLVRSCGSTPACDDVPPSRHLYVPLIPPLTRLLGKSIKSLGLGEICQD